MQNNSHHQMAIHFHGLCHMETKSSAEEKFLSASGQLQLDKNFCSRRQQKGNYECPYTTWDFWYGPPRDLWQGHFWYVPQQDLHNIHFWYSPQRDIWHAHVWYVAQRDPRHPHFWYVPQRDIWHVHFWYVPQRS